VLWIEPGSLLTIDAIVIGRVRVDRTLPRV
jgi:hypothetical protein